MVNRIIFSSLGTNDLPVTSRLITFFPSASHFDQSALDTANSNVQMFEEETRQFLIPFIKMRDLEVMGGESPWTKLAQVLVLVLHSRS